MLIGSLGMSLRISFLPLQLAVLVAVILLSGRHSSCYCITNEYIFYGGTLLLWKPRGPGEECPVYKGGVLISGVILYCESIYIRDIALIQRCPYFRGVLCEDSTVYNHSLLWSLSQSEHREETHHSKFPSTHMQARVWCHS